MAVANTPKLNQLPQPGSATCDTLVRKAISAIEEGKHLNIFVEVFADEALKRAALIDQKIQNKTAGKLAGMLVGLKDNMCYAHHRVTAASKILEDYVSPFSATVVDRLLAEDAILIGRLNCDEFAMGSSNENSIYGPVRNPLEADHVPGGSSGGSAAAVAAGLCHLALGSDTGGSIRQPASFCGIYGLKPTYGRVSRYGLIAFASSFDQIGILTDHTTHARLVMDTIAGHDPLDNTSSQEAVVASAQNIHFNANQKAKIGLIRQAIELQGADPEIISYTQKLAERLKGEGHSVEIIDFPYLDYVVPTYYILATAEASSNLSRYDGIRYGHRSDQAKDLKDVYELSRTEGFGSEVKRRIMLGTFVLSAGYYDAYYTKAQRVRRIIKDYTDKVMADYDFLLSPTTPDTPFKLNEKTKDPVKMYLSDIFTVHANLTGHPAINVPMATHSNGLPFGMHLLGDYFQEGKLLDFADHLMQLES